MVRGRGLTRTLRPEHRAWHGGEARLRATWAERSSNSSSRVTVLFKTRFGNGGSDRLKSEPKAPEPGRGGAGLPSGPGQRDCPSARSGAVCLAQSRPPGHRPWQHRPPPSASGSPPPLGREEHASQSAAPPPQGPPLTEAERAEKGRTGRGSSPEAPLGSKASPSTLQTTAPPPSPFPSPCQPPSHTCLCPSHAAPASESLAWHHLPAPRPGHLKQPLPLTGRQLCCLLLPVSPRTGPGADFPPNGSSGARPGRGP